MRLLVCVVVLNLCGSVFALADSAALSELPEGEELRVAYHSKGCFDERQYEIVFEHNATVTARAGGGKPVALSAAEVAGLDRLFEFYRSRPSGGCTTVNTITMSKTAAGKAISSESYVDGSCGTYQMKDVTRLPDIARKLGLE